MMFCYRCLFLCFFVSPAVFSREIKECSVVRLGEDGTEWIFDPIELSPEGEKQLLKRLSCFSVSMAATKSDYSKPGCYVMHMDNGLEICVYPDQEKPHIFCQKYRALREWRILPSRKAYEEIVSILIDASE